MDSVNGTHSDDDSTQCNFLNEYQIATSVYYSCPKNNSRIHISAKYCYMYTCLLHIQNYEDDLNPFLVYHHYCVLFFFFKQDKLLQEYIPKNYFSISRVFFYNSNPICLYLFLALSVTLLIPSSKQHSPVFYIKLLQSFICH